MGLSKSKPQPRKGEEQRKGSSYSGSKSKDRPSEKHSLEAEKLADSHFLRKGSAKHERPSASSEEKPDVKQKSNKKKFVIPQIIITRASNETLISYCSTGSEEQRTIREQADWGPYHRHRNPSTVAAYDLHTKE
ncbi:spermatogenesis-associated protein 33 [Callospermophilus lateralis]|uniref:spermatogenesis-associated protein 33 n=1 Tax=Callospermophilus lateralis TaxID=76772 RepID=UPI0040385CA5